MSVPEKTVVTAPAGDGAAEAYPLRVPRVDRGLGGCRSCRDRGRGRDRRARRRRIEPRCRRQRVSDRGRENRGALALAADAGERDARLRRPDRRSSCRPGRRRRICRRRSRPRHREAQLQTAQATLASDTATLDQASASLVGGPGEAGGRLRGRQRRREPAAAGSAGRRRPAPAPCATDAQTVSTDEQSATQAAAKVAADQQPGLVGDDAGLRLRRASLTADESSATVYGQSSTYTELPPVGQIVDAGPDPLRDQRPAGRAAVRAGRRRGGRSWPGCQPGATWRAEREPRGARLRHGLGGDAFTAATAAAIDAFQAAHGLSQTGAAAARLGRVRAGAGAGDDRDADARRDRAGGAGARDHLDSARQVTIALDAAQQSELKVGDPVTITLPDNSTTPGRVSYVGTVATPLELRPGRRRLGHTDDRGRRHPDRPGRDRASRPGAGQRLDHDRERQERARGAGERAAGARLRRLRGRGDRRRRRPPPGRRSARVCSTTQDGLVQITGTGLAAGQRVVVPSE